MISYDNPRGAILGRAVQRCTRGSRTASCAFWAPRSGKESSPATSQQRSARAAPPRPPPWEQAALVPRPSSLCAAAEPARRERCGGGALTSASKAGAHLRARVRAAPAAVAMRIKQVRGANYGCRGSQVPPHGVWCLERRATARGECATAGADCAPTRNEARAPRCACLGARRVFYWDKTVLRGAGTTYSAGGALTRAGGARGPIYAATLPKGMPRAPLCAAWRALPFAHPPSILRVPQHAMYYAQSAS